MLIATVSLGIFLLLGAIDGLYFHLIKFKLYLHAESRREHTIHCFRALVLIPYAYAFFFEQLKGALLFLGIAAFLLDLGLEIIDVLEEQSARKIFGGLHAPECLIHILGSSAKFSAALMIFHLRFYGAPIVGGPSLVFMKLFSGLLILGSSGALGFEAFSILKKLRHVSASLRS